MATALDVSRYIIKLRNTQNKVIKINNLKLQSLLYYSFAIHKVMNGNYLFEERLYTWKYGVKIKEVYNQYRKYGYSNISEDELWYKDINLNDQEKESVLMAWNQLGGLDTGTLISMIIKEDPYKFSYQNNSELSLDEVVAYFKENYVTEVFRHDS